MRIIASIIFLFFLCSCSSEGSSELELWSFRPYPDIDIFLEVFSEADAGNERQEPERLSFVCPNAFWYAIDFEPVSSTGPRIQYDFDQSVSSREVSGLLVYSITGEGDLPASEDGSLYQEIDFWFETDCFKSYLMSLTTVPYNRLNNDIVTSPPELPGCRECEGDDIAMYDNPIAGDYYVYSFGHLEQFRVLARAIDGCGNTTSCIVFCRSNNTIECHNFNAFLEESLGANFPVSAFRYICGVYDMAQRDCTF